MGNTPTFQPYDPNNDQHRLPEPGAGRNSVGVSIGEFLRRQKAEAEGRIQRGARNEYEDPLALGARKLFEGGWNLGTDIRRGFTGEEDPAIAGQRQALERVGTQATQPAAPVAPAGGGLSAEQAAAALKRGEARRQAMSYGVPTLSQSLDSPAGRGEGMTVPPPATPQPQRTPSQVKVSIGGKTYDYSEGQDPNAPALADPDGYVRGLKRTVGGAGPSGGTFAAPSAAWSPQPGAVSMVDTPHLRQEDERAKLQDSMPSLSLAAEAARLREQSQDPFGVRREIEGDRRRIADALTLERGKHDIRDESARMQLDETIKELQALDVEERSQLRQLRADPRYAQASQQRREQAEAVVRSDIKRRRAIHMAAVGGPQVIAHYLEQEPGG